MKNFIEELKWRGMLQDTTPGVEEWLSGGMRVGYIGFDPTAPSLTIGNYVQIMILSLFQECGHKPIILMGGATGRIGDPSGKDKERDLKSFDEIEKNLKYQEQIFKRFLNFDTGENKAILINNFDFYENMNALDFLRDVGKSITVNYMMSKESVKRRIETGISFTEFSYQLLQGYDFQKLYETLNCTIQMGGSDQWGNITTGTEFVRKNAAGKAYAITTPLLTKADGTKFGKSEKGNLWIDAAFTSPYAFYQFWINADDADLPKFIRYFTFKDKETVEALERDYADNPRALKAILAEELTRRIYSDRAYEAAMNVSKLLYDKKFKHEALLALPEEELIILSKEIPCMTIKKSLLTDGVNIMDLLGSITDVLASKSEVRRAIKNNAISINKQKITSLEVNIDAQILLYDKYILVENGKKNKYILLAE